MAQELASLDLLYPLDLYHLNLLYGLCLSWPDSGTKWTFIHFIREEATAMGGTWTNWVQDLPEGHNVKEDWLLYQMTLN